MQETWESWVRSLGQEDPLEEDVTTQSSILAREGPWTEAPGRLRSLRLQSWIRLSNWAHTRKQLIHNIVLVSGIQIAIQLCVYILQILFPYRLLQSFISRVPCAIQQFLWIICSMNSCVYLLIPDS